MINFIQVFLVFDIQVSGRGIASGQQIENADN